MNAPMSPEELSALSGVPPALRPQCVTCGHRRGLHRVDTEACPVLPLKAGRPHWREDDTFVHPDHFRD
jgi:hypothetical protein